MRGRTWIAILLGGTLGALIALAVLALVGARVIEDGVDATLLDASTLRARATFVVSQGGFHLLVLITGALGGGALGAIGSVIGREAGGDERRLSPTPLVLIGVVIGAAVAYATARASLGLAGSIDSGVVTVSVFRAILIALISGGVVGAVVGGTAERLSHPEVLGLEGEAWPSNPLAFVRDAATAMGLPALAVVVGIGLVYALSLVLLESSRIVALSVFGGLAALVLAGAAYLAAHPPASRESEE